MLLNIFKKLHHATRWSIAGLHYAYKSEVAFKLELLVAAVALPCAILLADDLSQLLWLMVSVLLILVVELLNTAIELIVDRIGTEQHELSMRAKDIGSAAVFLSVIIAAIVWGLMLLQHYQFYIK